MGRPKQRTLAPVPDTTEPDAPRRRWRVAQQLEDDAIYEEVPLVEWDRLGEFAREILHLPQESSIAFVRRVSAR